MRKEDNLMTERSDTVLESIKSNFKSLFSAEKKAAEYILNNPEEAIMLNISELAQKSGSSEATVVRMCKHVGYQGYYQMRLLMSNDLGKSSVSYDENEMLDSSQRLFEYSAARVAELKESIDIRLLIKVIGIVKKSRMVFVVATGNTTPIALDLGFRLERFGIPCSYSMIPEHFLNHVSLGTCDDTIIAISRSGASKQVLQAIELAKKKNMHTVVISAERHTQLSEYADCIIQVVEKKPKASVLQPDSHLLEIAISDALLYILQHYDTFEENTENEKKDEPYDDVELLLSEYKL
jgi:DNA-binding MurR/RpiR family transcriptional regulator